MGRLRVVRLLRTRSPAGLFPDRVWQAVATQRLSRGNSLVGLSAFSRIIADLPTSAVWPTSA
ncbi:hypothetical protein B0G77_8062 [Paraburkholderia sp. BL10I2N1]|nr:hypothetical protein B0G77_8062 [Paraburkholderia sp. BL10I2N1]